MYVCSHKVGKTFRDSLGFHIRVVGEFVGDVIVDL